MGLSISGVLALPNRELERWAKYWHEEPWGPHRDNMHAAMIVANLLLPHVKEGTKVDMQNFMFENPEDKRERERIATALRLDALSRASRKK